MPPRFVVHMPFWIYVLWLICVGLAYIAIWTVLGAILAVAFAVLLVVLAVLWVGDVWKRIRRKETDDDQ